VLGASDPEVVGRVGSALESEGYAVACFAAPEALLAGLDPAVTDLVVLAFGEAAEDARALCRQARSRCRGLPVAILLAAEGDDDADAPLSGTGADDRISLASGRGQLVERVRALLHFSSRLRAARDDATRLEDAQRIGQVGSWVLDPATLEMGWSAETYRILGLRPEREKTSLELFAMFVEPAKQESAIAQILEASESGQPFDFSYEMAQANGARRYVQLRGESAPTGLPGQVHGTIQDVTEQRRTQDAIRRLAHYDSLTGLSNRRRFTEQLERSTGRAQHLGQKMALLYLDLDQFKRINDTLGHGAGDSLLRHVSEVLFGVLRPSDIIARNVDSESDVEVSRLGGDEFAILLSDIPNQAAAGQVAERILTAITAPTTFEEHSIATSASIGIATYPDDGETAEELIKHADIAMYEAKERGRNNFQFYSARMNEGSLHRLRLETHLRHALEHEELRLVYQPRIDLQDPKIVGMEALLRWDSAEFGAVSPKDFVPVAEETGLIIPIGEWVLRTACEQTKAWRVAGYPKVRVSVNVSPRQFVHHDIRETVVETLKATGLDPAQLELEITESVLLEDNPSTGDMLRELKAMGVSLALDDFGTGYSSMGYLTRLPLDTLKLDGGRGPAGTGALSARRGLRRAPGLPGLRPGSAGGFRAHASVARGDPGRAAGGRARARASTEARADTQAGSQARTAGPARGLGAGRRRARLSRTQVGPTAAQEGAPPPEGRALAALDARRSA
jgi:diguanylate cyclase (GGDEF)-like protein